MQRGVFLFRNISSCTSPILHKPTMHTICLHARVQQATVELQQLCHGKFLTFVGNRKLELPNSMVPKLA